MGRRGLTFGIVLFLVALLAACSQIATPGAEVDLLARGGSGKGKRPIVEPPTETMSACTALYATDGAQATLNDAVLDANIAYGTVGTLILSFNFEDALVPAATFITNTLGIEQGEGLGVFENLPMIAIETLLTKELIATLKANLQPYGLLSIYQDHPFEYFLRESTPFVGAGAARETFSVTGRGVGVAVLDSGIDETQGDFANVTRNVKIVGPIVNVGVGGYFTVDTPNSDTSSGHGTHVAGTISGTAAMSNGRYMGMAPEANLVGIGAGDARFVLYTLQGFDFAMNPDVRDPNNIRVISNSWGSSGDFAPFHPISLASKRAYDMDMVVVFAAGNAGPDENTMNPYSVSPCVIAVAAGDKSGGLADFSSRGIPGDDAVRPDITAPGVQIVAARANTAARVPYTADPEYGLHYTSLSGTSMAAPHISGIAALMLEANPALNLDGVLDILVSTARPMYDGSRQYEPWEVGAGYVNAFAAVQKAVESAGTRTVTTTVVLDDWTSTVGAAINVPLVGPAVEAEDNYTLNIPSGASALRVSTTWGDPVNDLDLYVYDPNGSLVASSTDFGTLGEAVSVPNPAAGAYRVQLKGYLNTPVVYEGHAEVDTVTIQ